MNCFTMKQTGGKNCLNSNASTFSVSKKQFLKNLKHFCFTDCVRCVLRVVSGAVTASPSVIPENHNFAIP